MFRSLSASFWFSSIICLAVACGSESIVGNPGPLDAALLDTGAPDTGPTCIDRSDCAPGEACIAGECTACTSNADCMGEACIGGVCAPCVSRTQCTAGEACIAGACTTCASRADCGGVDSCVAGVCVLCVPVAEICNGVDDNCNDLVDDGVGAGGTCGTNPDPCQTGVVACVAGALVCGDNPSSPTSAGTPCAGGVCSGTGTCNACSTGTPCGTNPSACYNGAIQCGTGAAVCADELSAPKPAGTACAGGVCSGTGTCTACSSGAPCSTNPGACYDGAIQCGTGAAVCADDPSAPKPAGTACAGGVCSAGGTCTLTPVDCVGAWSSCSASCGGTQTFSISTPAANGGAPCTALSGAVRSCNTMTGYACPAGYGWSGLSLDCLTLNSSQDANEMCCLAGSAVVRCVVGSANVSGCTAVSAPMAFCF